MIEIKLTPAQNQWLEVSWTEVTQLPDTITPARPALFDAEGNEVQAAMPETTSPGGERRTELKCTSYHPTQLDLIHADCAKHGVTIEGDDAEVIAQWVADYVPEPPPVLTPEARWAAIKAIRDSKTQTGGYKVGANWFHSDTFSRTQQMGLVMMGGGMPTGLAWKTMSGAFVPMTPALAQQIFAAAAQQDASLFDHAEALKADPQADISAGWPATFQGA